MVRGIAEQWIKGGEVRPEVESGCPAIGLWPTGCVCLCSSWRNNLGSFLRRLCLPKAVERWSLRSVQVKLIKMGGRLARYARRLIFQLSEVWVPRRLFQ